MIDPDALLHQRFRDARPGLTLIAVENGALPVTTLGVDVLAQDKKRYPLLHEFVLRLTGAGIATTSEMASFLGIEDQLVQGAAAEQISADNLMYSSSRRQVTLTSRGQNATRELEAIEPVHVQIPVAFDRLLWSAAAYDSRDLITKQEAQERGMLILPPSKKAHILAEEIPSSDVNGVLKAREYKASLKREVLAVRGVKLHTHRYLPVKVLIYTEPPQNDAEVAILIDGDTSPLHDSALNLLGGAELLGVRIGEPYSRPRVPDNLESIRVESEAVSNLRSATIEGRLQASETDASAIADPEPSSEAERALAKISVRSVSVFEHRELLSEALENTKSRLLIISPWVRSAVVDRVFIQQLESRLRAGVRVCIGHGIGHDDRGSDARALDRLQKLEERYGEKFKLVRLANTHAKVLIADDKWVATSFNWLSFRGDPDRTYRMEEGTLVQIPGQVTSEYERYLQMVEDQSVPHKKTKLR